MSLGRHDTEVLVELMQGTLGYDLSHLGKPNVGARNFLMMVPVVLAPPRRFVTPLPELDRGGAGRADNHSSIQTRLIDTTCVAVLLDASPEERLIPPLARDNFSSAVGAGWRAGVVFTDKIIETKRPNIVRDNGLADSALHYFLRVAET